MFLIDKNLNPSVETKPDPRSIEGLIAWLETMPAGKRYCWHNEGVCLFSQYGEAHYAPLLGTDAYEAATCAFKAFDGDCGGGEPFGLLAITRPHTFGAALDRARAYQAKVRT